MRGTAGGAGRVAGLEGRRLLQVLVCKHNSPEVRSLSIVGSKSNHISAHANHAPLEFRDHAGKCRPGSWPRR